MAAMLKSNAMGKRFIIHVIMLLICFQELARERQENDRLLKAHQDKDDLIGKLREEIDLLNRVSPAYLIFYSNLFFAFLCVFMCGWLVWVGNHHLAF